MNNPCNKLITEKDVIHILNYYGNIGNDNEKLIPKNLDNYQTSFVHESFHQWTNNYLSNSSETSNEKIYLNYIPKESNERLEFLGDSVLKYAIGRYLYQRFPQEREGRITTLKIKLEKSCMLHKFAHTLGFKEFLLLSLQVENLTILDYDRGRGNHSYFEDAFEAFVGAIIEDFGDYGVIYAERFIVNIIENIVDFSELILVNENFKDSLQRYYQKNSWKTPTYSTLCDDGPLYRKIFTRYTVITNDQFKELDLDIQEKLQQFNNDLFQYYNQDAISVNKLMTVSRNNCYILAIGYGKVVKNAEQECAKNGLLMLKLSLNY